MYANSFNRTSLPYYFNTSEYLSGEIHKITSVPIYKGREGVVTKDSTDFYYAVGDIAVDGQNVDFIEMPDTIVINDLLDINEHLISEPFEVTSNSTLTYGVQYGIIDSTACGNSIVRQQ